MKFKLKNSVLTGGIVLLILSALVLANPVMAANCSVERETDVGVNEGKRVEFKISVKCDVRRWTWKTFRYNYRTVDDTAKSSDDYRGKVGAHTFNNPHRNTTYVHTARVKAKSDDVCESTEKFKMVYELEGKTKAGWSRWPQGKDGLPGKFTIKAHIADKTSGC